MSTANDNLFTAVAGSVEWLEEPAVELSEWRVQLPLARLGGLRGGALQVEWMVVDRGTRDEPDIQGTMLVSLVDKNGQRSDEACLPVEQVRALKALLNASLLPDDVSAHAGACAD